MEKIFIKECLRKCKTLNLNSDEIIKHHTVKDWAMAYARRYIEFNLVDDKKIRSLARIIAKDIANGDVESIVFYMD